MTNNKNDNPFFEPPALHITDRDHYEATVAGHELALSQAQTHWQESRAELARVQAQRDFWRKMASSWFLATLAMGYLLWSLGSCVKN